MSKNSYPRKQWRENVASEMIRHIENGTAPWQKPWKPGVIGHMQHNPKSERAYRGINALWLEMQGYDDPRWMTLKQANELGASVRTGEKSVQVEYWQWSTKRPMIGEDSAPVLDENGKQRMETVQLDRPRVFYANVFNAEQLDGLEPYKAPVPTFEPSHVAEQMLEDSNVPVMHDQNDRAFYDPGEDKVHLPDIAAFPDAYKYYSVALHEIGHATGHRDRLARDFGPFGSEAYAKEELRAEMASYITARDLGLGHNPSRHASYLEGWVKAIQDDPNILFQAARDAEQIATWIKEPDLRPRLERDAQSKRKVRTMERKELQAGHDQNEITNEQRAEENQKAYEADARDLEADLQATVEETHAFWSSTENRENLANLQGEWKTKTLSEERYLQILSQVSTAFASDAKAHMFLDAAENHSPLFVRFGHHQLASDYAEGKINEREAISLDVQYTRQLGEEPKPELSDIHELYQEQKLEKERTVQDKPKRVYLAVPYSEKDQAKQHGAKWDGRRKSWYVQNNTDLALLKKWLPENQPELKAEVDPRKEFADELKRHNVVIKGVPLMDGKWHRVPFEGEKGGKQSASYRAFLDGRPSGQIHDYRTKETHKWVSTGNTLSPEQRAKIEAEAAEKQQRRAEERLNLQKDARLHAMKRFDEGMYPIIWEKGGDIEREDYPYLNRKNVGAYGIHQEKDGTLLIPARTVDGKLWSVQTIDHDGTKRFQKNARKQGLMHIIDPDNKIGEKTGLSWNRNKIGKGSIIISEGYATAATLHEVTKRPTVVAFDAGNLMDVAKAVRERYPDATIVIGGDNDHKHELKRQGNVGKEHAQDAAFEVGGYVAIPQFTETQKKAGLTDWNDLANSEGEKAVLKQMKQQLSRQHYHQIGHKPEDRALEM